MADTEQARAEAHTDPGHWVELRIHGVSGTPPEAMLESAHVRQVAGDAWGRFFRPVDGLGTEIQDDPHRTLEGYHWGRFTSGSWLEGLWLILIPFGMVNAAAFMVPDPGPSRASRLLRSFVLSLIRAVALGLTCTFALASGLILVDLVGYHWASRLQWLSAVRSGWSLAGGVLLAGVVVLVLHRLGDQNRESDFDPAPPGSLAGSGTPVGLCRPAFFQVAPKSAPTLGRVHLAAGWAVVSLVAVLTWQSIADVTGDRPAAWAQHVAWAGALAILTVASVVAFTLGDPDQAISGTSRYVRWQRTILIPLSQWLVGLAGLDVVASAALLIRTDTPSLRLNVDAYARFLPAASTVTLLMLLVGSLWLARQTEGAPGASGPAPYRRFARGAGAWALTSTGLFLGVGFCAAFDLGVAKTVGKHAQTDLIYRVAYAWGMTVLLGVVLVAVTIGRWARDRSRYQDEAEAAYLRVTSGGLSSALPPPWPRQVGDAMSMARLKRGVAWPFVVFAGSGWVMTAVMSAEMFHWATPGWLAWLSHGLDVRRASTEGTQTFVILYNLGTYTLIALAGLLFYVGRRALRTEQARRGANVVWDVISFWPHSVHPFVPPAYSQFAVRDLRRRIRFHLGLLPEQPERVADAVVVSAHSQGSLIAFATMLWLGDDEVGRVGMVTYGSQLQVAFPRGFPSYVNYPLLEQVLARLEGRWVNLYRDTDPIAGPVLSWKRSSVGGPAPDSWRIGGPEAAQPDRLDPVTGRRESGHDWRVLDPSPVDHGLQSRTLVQLSRHSGYPASPDYPAAVRAVRP